MYIIPEFNHQPNSNIKIESYNGRIKTLKDALLILEGTRLGLLPKVKRRLNGLEREFITNGKIFAWNETECGMKRWTDGKNWSASKVNGPFLVYKELDSDKLTTKPNGLIKQSFSLTTKQGEKFHLIGYFKDDDEELANKLPSNDAMLKGLKLNDNVYQEYLLYYDQYLNNEQEQVYSYLMPGQAMGMAQPLQPVQQIPMQNVPIVPMMNVLPGYQSHLSLSAQSLPTTFSNQSSFSSSSSFSGPATVPVHGSVNSSISSASTSYYPVYRNPDSPPQTIAQPSYQVPTDNLSTLASLSQDHRYYVQPTYPYYTYGSTTSPTQTQQTNPQIQNSQLQNHQPQTQTHNSIQPLNSFSNQHFQTHSIQSQSVPSASQIPQQSQPQVQSSSQVSPQPITSKIYSLNNGSSMSISPGNRDDHATLKILDRGFSNQS